MTLLELGWNADLQCNFKKLSRQDFVPARVSSVMKGHIGVWGESGDGLTRLSGKLLFRAKSNSDLPAVGDWVAIDGEAGNNRGVIHHVLPRRSKISRKIAGRAVDEQVIATNIDTVFIVGVRSVPAVVIDGKLASCCAGRGPEEKVLRAALA